MRPDKFKKALHNIVTMTRTDFKVLVSCDVSDRTMNNPSMIEYAKTQGATMFFGPSRGKVDAINRDMDKAGEWDILVNFSDDMMFVVKGWDRLLRSQVSAAWPDLDWFAHYNDGYLRDKLPTMSIMGRAYFERFNYIYHPAYRSFSCDAEAMCVAMMLGKYRYFNDVLFKHEHPANNRSLRGDQLYAINGRFGPVDTSTYFKRLNNYFDQDPALMPHSFKIHVGKRI
jgi:hypothetical protein